MFERCPKCGHRPLPADQALPAECPACGVILAKIGALSVRAPVSAPDDGNDGDDTSLRDLLWHVPERIDTTAYRVRVGLLVALALWGLHLAAMDYRDGEIMGSFIHAPLIVFHEAGHVVFRPFGEWVMTLGGTLGQLLMPAILCIALLWKNRDPFGASVGLWFLGVSVLDVAPYIYDALDPQLMLLSGTTGADGPHDWIYLLESAGKLSHAQGLGAFVHAIGVAVVLLALAWGAGVLRLQRRRVAGDVLIER